MPAGATAPLCGSSSDRSASKLAVLDTFRHLKVIGQKALYSWVVPGGAAVLALCPPHTAACVPEASKNH